MYYNALRIMVALMHIYSIYGLNIMYAMKVAKVLRPKAEVITYVHTVYFYVRQWSVKLANLNIKINVTKPAKINHVMLRICKLRYCSNVTSHMRVPYLRVENCYTPVNCNNSWMTLCLFACSNLCVCLVSTWFTLKSHTQSAYTHECHFSKL